MRLQSPAGFAGSQTAPQTFRALCDPSESVGDVVYVQSDAVGDLVRVRRVNIDDDTKRPGIGIIVKKFNDSLCAIQTSGVVHSVFTGLTHGKHYFINDFGSLSAMPPEPPTSGTRMVQCVAYALGSNILLINVMLPVIKNSM